MQQLPLGVRPSDTARFETFVAGPEPRGPATARGSGTPPGPVAMGPAGHRQIPPAAGRLRGAGDRGGAATYIDLETTPAPGWLDGCESLDLVGLDGLDPVAADADWNAAIFRLHTLMQDGPGRLLVSSTAPPAALSFKLADLRSRLLSAPVHQLRELDEEGHIQALEDVPPVAAWNCRGKRRPTWCTGCRATCIHSVPCWTASTRPRSWRSVA